MAKKPKVYRPLVRTTLAGTGTYASLWLAADHLISVRSNGYREEYSRFEFRDIKGFFVTESPRRGWWTTIWGLLGVVALIVVLANLGNDETPVISAVFLAVFVAAVIWNFILGPGCRVYVVTNVQTALVPAVHRQKKARRVLGRIDADIRAAQADLVPPPSAPVNPDPTTPSV